MSKQYETIFITPMLAHSGEGKKLITQAYEAFKASPQGALYASAEDEYGGAQYWIEKSQAGTHHPQDGTPDFKLAVVVSRNPSSGSNAPTVEGIVTSDYYHNGVGQAVYSVLANGADEKEIGPRMKTATFHQLTTAALEENKSLKAIVEEVEPDGRSLLNGTKVNVDYVQPNYNMSPLRLEVTPVGDQGVDPNTVELYLDGLKAYFGESPEKEAQETYAAMRGQLEAIKRGERPIVEPVIAEARPAASERTGTIGVGWAGHVGRQPKGDRAGPQAGPGRSNS